MSQTHLIVFVFFCQRQHEKPFTKSGKKTVTNTFLYSRKEENSRTRNDDGTNIAFIENFPWYDSEKEGKSQLYAPYPSGNSG